MNLLTFVSVSFPSKNHGCLSKKSVKISLIQLLPVNLYDCDNLRHSIPLAWLSVYVLHECEFQSSLNMLSSSIFVYNGPNYLCNRNDAQEFELIQSSISDIASFKVATQKANVDSNEEKKYNAN